MTMTREKRFDRDLVWVAPASGTADRADNDDAREDRLRELREYVARAIQAWELDARTPRQPQVLRARFIRQGGPRE
jgi:hypothetical protein